MNDVLTQIFGENGPFVGQVAIAAAVTLVLLGLLVWLLRRVARLRLGATAPGRVPRLAIVDVLPIDGRRQLLLVRRDSVEHLILVGGPSDLVIEPSITRTRQRPAQHGVNGTLAATTAGAPAPLPTTMPAPAAANGGTDGMPPASPSDAGAPLPFPFSRIPSPRPSSGVGNVAAPPDDARGQSAFAPSASWSGPSAILPVLDAGPGGVGAAVPAAPRSLGAAFPAGGPGVVGESLPAPKANGATAAAAPGAPQSVVEDGASHRVSALEAEMNRLLGQISSDRRSS
jgi:flagellar protein FliO/FliZ